MYETKCNSCTQHRNRMTQRPSKNVKHAPALLFFFKKAQCVSSATRRLSVKKQDKRCEYQGIMGWNSILVTLAETFRDVWELNRFRFRVRSCQGSSLCLRFNRKVDRTTRNIRGSPPRGKAWLTTVLKYETTVLFKTICRTEENTAAHLNVGSCFKVVRGFILYAATAPPDLCLCMCVCWCEKGEQRASRAMSEHQGQPQSWCPRWRTKQCCWLS